MKEIMRAIGEAGKPLTGAELRRRVVGDSQRIDRAVRVLLQAGALSYLGRRGYAIKGRR
jgi:hypothetical protein